MGKPKTKSKIAHNDGEAPLGAYSQTWRYPELGLELTIHGKDPKLEDGSMTNLEVSAGSTIKSRLGIGVGSSEADARAVYGPFLNAESSTTHFLAIGWEWTFLVFEVRDGKVVKAAYGFDALPSEREE